MPGRPAERRLKSGEAHAFGVTLAANQYVKGAVEQDGVDVEVTVLDPSGAVVMKVDSPTGTAGPEPVEFVGAAPGLYRMLLKAQSDPASEGSYAARLDVVRTATPADERRAVAAALRRDADALNVLHDTDSLAAAEAKYREAMEHLAAAGDELERAETMVKVAETYLNRRDYKKANETALAGLAVAERLGDLNVQAHASYVIGYSIPFLGDPMGGVAKLKRAVELYHEAKNEKAEAEACHYAGFMLAAVGDYAGAVEYQKRSYEISGRLHDVLVQNLALNGLGEALRMQGEYAAAYNVLTQALALNPWLKDPSAQGRALYNLADVRTMMGDPASALELTARAVELTLAAKDRRNEAVVRQYRGLLLLGMDPEASRKEFEEARRLFQITGDTTGMLAVEYGLALARFEKGEIKEVLPLFEEMAPKLKASGNVSATLDNEIIRARCFASLGDTPKAIALVKEALAMAREVGSKTDEGRALGHLANFYRDTGDLPTARDYARAETQVYDGIRGLARQEGLRMDTQWRLGAASRLADIEMRLSRKDPSGGYEASALETSEAGRARLFLETIAAAGVDLYAGVTPELAEAARTVRRRLNVKLNEQVRLLGDGGSKEELAAVAKAVQSLQDAYGEAEAKVRDASPRYAALTKPQPATVERIRTELLDDDTALIEYKIGINATYAWVVTRDGISSYDLPAPDVIDAAAQRVRELMTARTCRGKFETAKEAAARVKAADAELPKAAAELSRMVLGPMAGKLGAKRLAIVADSALHLVPFAALPEPGGTEPLIAKHEVVSLPSATALLAIRGEYGKRPAASEAVAVFADPVFDVADARVRGTKPGGRAGDGAIASRGGGDARRAREVASRGACGDRGSLDRLLGTRREADAIAGLAPAGRTMKVLDFAANLERATSADLAKYRIVHFATHGYVPAEAPDLSGLVLSLVDERGSAREGYLGLPDVYNLKLNADLVVLSGCETGLGKQVAGEGLVGLTRGFMYAGAKSVVASLWKVDDAPTAELMTAMYRSMLKEGKRPSEALREAQLAMLRSGRWSQPYYWAAFGLYGDWR